MKKLFLLSSFLFATICTVSAQDNGPIETLPPTYAAVADEAISAGNWMVGGNIGSLSHNFDTETFQFRLVPNAAYFVSDNFAIGAQAIVGLTAYNGGTNFDYAVAPMFRYYFGEGGSSSGRFFGEAEIGFAGSSVKDNPTDENFSFLFGVKAGYARFIAENVAVEGTVGYTDTEADILGAGLLSGVGFSVGFQVYLPGQER